MEDKLLIIVQKKFLDYLKKQGKSSSTILAYNNDLNQFTDFLNKRQITQVTSINKEQVEEFKEFLNFNKYLPKSASRKLNAIKSFFRYLKNQNLIEGNPSENVDYPQYETKPPRILTQMEYRSLRDAVRNDIRLAAVIELLLQTGMRIGELARLELDDLKDSQIRIRAYESQPERLIILNQAAKKALDHWLDFRTKTKTKNIFITKTGRPFLIRNIRTIINRYFKEAEIKNATINDLRHTFIAHQLSNGTSVVLIQKLVGHKR
ncbi:MAG: tyrosine-type recombinase/integrase, partial [Candidatus Shapirobacteria bacterium]|nr:tyrosine-type recombinase/integrase [Candidatus Shapirobacteria bacterium]